MKLTHVMTYDAPAGAVYAMLTDPEFQDGRAQAGNPLEASASVTAGADGGATIAVSRLLAIDLGGMLQKVIGDKIRIEETQTWLPGPLDADAREGALKAVIPGQPAGVNGRLVMSGAGAQTTIRLDAEIKVSVPMIGGKAESMIAEVLTKFLDKEEELGRAWLSGDAKAL
ncbi:MAG: DUF2505 domain-containing protein [Sporichthyaceae bacterium]|jgi:hypothetical protein